MKIMAKAFLIHDGKVLLLTRSFDDVVNPGRLDLVGGGIDSGESVLEGVRREIQEEAGLTVLADDLHEIVYTALDSNDPNVEKHVFYTIVPSAEITLSHEHCAANWLEPELALALYPHPYYSPALQRLIDEHIL